MNVILADDERLIRSSIRSMLEEAPIPIRIVGEARNGEELLELVRTTSPDLIFVDIRMPKMDGLEAIRRGKPYAPGASWVILTGFSEFKYAQEAIRLGASNYLLKPVEPEELEKCVREAAEEQSKMLHAMNCEFEHWISARLRRADSRDNEQADDAYEGYRLASFLMYPNAVESESRAADTLQRVVQRIQQEIALQPGHKETLSGIASFRSGTLLLFLALPRAAGRSEDIIGLIETRMLAYLNRTDRHAFHLLKSGAAEDARSLLRELEELHRLATLRVFFTADERALTVKVLRDRAANPEAEAFASLSSELVACFRSKDYVGYLQRIASLKKINTDWLQANKEAYKQLSLHLWYAIRAESRADFEPAQWISSLQKRGEAMLASTHGSQTIDRSDVIRRVIDYVDKHYMEDIAIGNLAGELNVTPNYLSTLFHKKNGTTFVKYVANTRMLKAKELLLTKPELKVQDVAQLVGYFSTRHFTKLFLEHFGCYPSEIRERIIY